LIGKIDIEKRQTPKTPLPWREGDKKGDNAPSHQPSPIKGEGEVDQVNFYSWVDSISYFPRNSAIFKLHITVMFLQVLTSKRKILILMKIFSFFG